VNRLSALHTTRADIYARAELLFYSENRVPCGLGKEFDDGLSWNLHLLLHLWIKNPCAPSSSGNPPLYSPCRRPTRYIAVSMDPVPESKTIGQATNGLAARYQGHHQHRPYAESASR
jgi:hypothetical protein